MRQRNRDLGASMDQDVSQDTRVQSDSVPSASGPSAVPGEPAPRAPKKRKKGCLVALVAVLVLLVGVVIGTVVILRGATQPEDLGVAYSEADFDSAMAKLGVAWPELPEGADPENYERRYIGSKPMDVTLSEAELSALMSYRHASSYWPVKSMQIDLQGGGKTRAAAVVAYGGRDWPVTLTGSGSMSGRSLDVSIASAGLAGIAVPKEYLPLGESFIEGMVNARLARIPGLDVASLEVDESGVHATGTIWERAEYVEK
jgi:hypothetical protein